MKKEFVPYQESLELKELGFDESCFGRYIYDGRGKEWFLVQTQQTKNASVIFEGDISVNGISVASPLYQQAFRWFRGKCGLYNIVDINSFPISFYYVITKITQGGIGVQAEKFNINTYEEAELACLIKLIEIVKQK